MAATARASSISISDVLANIQSLQTTEQSLISQLDIYTSKSGGYVATDKVIVDLIAKINSIANARIAMFKTISANAAVMQSGVSQSRVDLVNQMTLLQVVEDQLNQAKEKIQQLSNRNDTQMRMVEINTYYGQRYEAQSKLMKKIILVCLPILILFILKKIGILPAILGNYIIGSVIAVGAIIIINGAWDIYTRNNMDFNSYEWKYEQPEAQLPSIMQYNRDNFFDYRNLFNNLLSNVGICVGDSCCAPGTVYDATNFQCIVPPISVGADPAGATAKLAAATQQGFTSGNGLQGTVIGSYMDDDNKDFNGITPFSPVTDFALVI
jgi:hypothetical protein